ncbi:hypothetical protein ACFV98_38760 [Streptomyces violascens]|uniref:hypothetical protein n=1 Tax=Streptomyces violascens TaxID=67381 RepID=UPI0036643F67
MLKSLVPHLSGVLVEQVGFESGVLRLLVALAGQLVRREWDAMSCVDQRDHGAVFMPKDQRLMSWGVPECRDDLDARPEGHGAPRDSEGTPSVRSRQADQAPAAAGGFGDHVAPFMEECGELFEGVRASGPALALRGEGAAQFL